MANAISKSQLAAAIAEKAEISKKQAVEILEHIADLAYKHAKDTFTLPGIGKLVLKNRAARMGRNPKTGARGIGCPAGRRPIPDKPAQIICGWPVFRACRAAYRFAKPHQG